MKTAFQILAALASASVLLATSTADARERLRKNETWCLETALGGRGGGTVNLCKFETRAQCVESKVAQGDHCELNPVIAFEQWNKAHGYR